ncbi:mechanosensitive ion channel [Flavobacteriales bacterium]|jgi:small conductance mechanosensitive channel|nr:mechanosensitive ion channel [Flavobacteriales bacterium]
MPDSTSEIQSGIIDNLGWLKDKVIEYGIALITAVAIIVIGFWLVKRIKKIMAKFFIKKDFDPSLETFLMSLTSIALRILVIITALSQLGIEMTSFVALLGAAGLAIGMAFSGTLSNLAGGVMILFFKPYKVGDYIEAQGEIGHVKELQIFNTILITLDNKTVIIPNGPLANGNMTNYSTQTNRRVDFVVGIAYGDSYDTAKETLLKFVKEDPRIMDEEDNFIGLGELADSSVNLTLRVWCKTEDYWGVFFTMNERIYKEFGDRGLNIPFPQMDVHVKNS